jgi:hypothetical protein
VSVRIGISGHGRLGGLVAEAADDLELVWALGRDGTPDPDIDVALDLSNADAAPDHLAWCAATGTDLVIGATGWDRAALTPAPRVGWLRQQCHLVCELGLPGAAEVHTPAAVPTRVGACAQWPGPRGSLRGRHTTDQRTCGPGLTVSSKISQVRVALTPGIA